MLAMFTLSCTCLWTSAGLCVEHPVAPRHSYLLYEFFFIHSKVFTTRMVFSCQEDQKCFLACKRKISCMQQSMSLQSLLWCIGVPCKSGSLTWSISVHMTYEVGMETHGKPCIFPNPCLGSAWKIFFLSVQTTTNDKEHSSNKAGGIISSWIPGIILCPVLCIYELHSTTLLPSS